MFIDRLEGNANALLLIAYCLLDQGNDVGLVLLDVSYTREGSISGRLCVWSGRMEQSARVIQQHTLEEPNHARVFSRANDHRVGTIDRIRRLAPLQLFFNTTRTYDRSKERYFVSPLFEGGDILINGWIQRMHRGTKYVCCHGTVIADSVNYTLGYTHMKLQSALVSICALALFATPLFAQSSHVMTKEQQDALTPDAVLTEFAEGNLRFSQETITKRDHSAMVRKTASGQYPKAVILSCLDSRIPIEDVLDQGLGDIFVARIAGNIVNDDILASMEFGCAVMGSKVVLVVGHSNCGAIKGAIDDVELGHIGILLSKIRPVVAEARTTSSDRTSKNASFVEFVSQAHVDHVVAEIRRRSTLLANLEKAGKIKIVGSYYDLETGVLTVKK